MHPIAKRLHDYFQSPKFHEDFQHQLEKDRAEGAVFRRNLVEQFNAVQGPPGPEIQAYQARFIDGEMTVEERIEYRYRCQDAIKEAKDSEAS